MGSLMCNRHERPVALCLSIGADAYSAWHPQNALLPLLEAALQNQCTVSLGADYTTLLVRNIIGSNEPARQ